jgi:putative glutamine amidotransferase
MSAAPSLPLVGLPCCRSEFKRMPFHIVGDKYVAAVLAGAEALPLLIPALGEALPVEALLDRLDGLLLTGSPSNIEPHHYDGPAPPDGNPTDPGRDATTLPLIRRAVARGLPVLGICRGLQELNVALGGTLLQEVHKAAGRRDHRADPTETLERQYGPAHEVTLVPGGWLHGLAGCDTITVNSLHGQGIERPAPGLSVEATAPDGQIEAVRASAAGFVVGLQWHPEYRFAENALSRKLFAAFGAACRRYAGERGRAA